jgi:hypothetical protein
MNLLTTDLTNVDISRPLLPKGGPVRLTITEMKVEKSKDGQKDLLVTTFKTVFKCKSAPNSQGATVDLNPGFTMIDRMTLTPSEKRSEEQILGDLARRRSEILGSAAGSFMPLEQYLNKQVDAMIGIEVDESGAFGDQNRIKKLAPVK